MPHHVGARFGWLGKPNHKTDPAAPPKIPFASTKLAQAMIGEYETHTFKILMKFVLHYLLMLPISTFLIIAWFLLAGAVLARPCGDLDVAKIQKLISQRLSQHNDSIREKAKRLQRKQQQQL